MQGKLTLFSAIAAQLLSSATSSSASTPECNQSDLVIQARCIINSKLAQEQRDARGVNVNLRYRECSYRDTLICTGTYTVGNPACCAEGPTSYIEGPTSYIYDFSCVAEDHTVSCARTRTENRY
jgi:hypothetical protein